MQSKWNSQNALQIMIVFEDLGFTKEAVRNEDVRIIKSNSDILLFLMVTNQRR